MPIKSKPVRISLIPGFLKRLTEFGREHQMQTRSGELQLGRISRKILEFILKLREDPDVRRYLDRHGGTFLDLIQRAVQRYISGK